MDAAAPLGNGEMTILKVMESLDQEHEQYMQDPGRCLGLLTAGDT